MECSFNLFATLACEMCLQKNLLCTSCLPGAEREEATTGLSPASTTCVLAHAKQGWICYNLTRSMILRRSMPWFLGSFALPSSWQSRVDVEPDDVFALHKFDWGRSHSCRTHRLQFHVKRVGHVTEGSVTGLVRTCWVRDMFGVRDVPK